MKPSTAKVHPQLRQAVLDVKGLPISAWTLWLVRLLERFTFRPLEMPADVTAHNARVAGRDGAKIRVRIYRAVSGLPKAPGLFWIHGGGMVAGRPEMDDSWMLRFVRDTGAVVVSVRYRLAPRHPFPTPLDDCHDVLRWMFAEAGRLGVDAAHVAIGGASAGGGLAASLAQRVHDDGGTQPVLQLLVYPMLDDRTAARRDIDPKAHIGWNNASNAFGWGAYLGQSAGAAHVPAGSVPARREDLSGLPPAWIGVGTIDLFCEEDVAYAERLKAAGVACHLVTVPGAYHAFDFILDPAVPRPPIVEQFYRSQVDALRAAYGAL
jgi:acetyl esterase/lipase